MNDTDWSRVSDVLGRALDVPPTDRDAFLEGACRSDDGTVDAALRLEVEALLDASDAADLEDALRSPISSLVEATVVDDVPVGTAVGPWRLTGVLGEGGMGIVYRAERSDGLFEREVALKRLRSGPGRKKLAARLRAERQTLARLEHPGIARLYDGGVSEDGTPYLVLELVEGETITRWASRTKASVEDRIRLFVRVCEAVAYAHARLVVHRDLKPSNVFVLEDGEPRAKLLDFGIAKLLDATDVTQTSGTAMTPAYAAPEQLLGQEVTTATDVYALGVVLYEVLTGERPYDVSGATASEAERIVRETTPPRPSSRTENRALEGDLDTIVLKALAKEPERRYPTAAALADDLERHLSGLPVEARPATMSYRVGRFVRRHRAAAAAVAVALVALVSGLGAALWQAGEARAEATRAEAALAETEGAFGFLEDTILVGNPSEGDADTPISVVLDSAAVRVEDETEPAVAAVIHTSLANVYLGRGLLDQAEHHARRAIELFSDDAQGFRPGSAQHALALALAESGRAAQAIPHHEAAVQRMRDVVAQDTTNEVHTKLLASTLSAMGASLELEDRIEEAEAAFRESLTYSDPEYDLYFSTLNNLALLNTNRGRFQEAAETLDKIVDAFRAKGTNARYELSFALGNQAAVLSELGPEQGPRAMELYQEAIDIATDLLGLEHPGTFSIRINRVGTLRRIGRIEDAQRDGDAVLEDARRVLGDDDFMTAFAQNMVGTTACQSSDPERGLRLLQESQETRVGMLPESHWILSNGESVMGECLLRLGRRAEGERLLRRSYPRLLEALSPVHPRVAEARQRLEDAGLSIPG
ncbi:protein kinase domain-containing protein [Rubrivirga sp.]|uniref:serine/threonine-protein kinase n=1 Tax=Rubrivirga sp. TaxID=1885344 RepID=UPI003C740412